MMSKNIGQQLWNTVRENSLSTFLVIGKNNDFNYICQKFSEVTIDKRMSTLIYYAPELKKNKHDLSYLGFEITSENIKRWKLKSHLKSIFGKSNFQETIDKLYENDSERIYKIRLQYLLGPRIFLSVSRLFSRTNLAKILMFILLTPFMVYSLFKIIIGFGSGSDTCVKYQNEKGDTIYLLSSHMPNKDHYGEAPLDISKRKEILSNIGAIIPQNENVCVLIVSGARYRWYQEILNQIKNDLKKEIFFFVLSAWRTLDKEKFRECEGGAFIAGSNFTGAGYIVFSDHCISIGALDHELWFKKECIINDY